MSAAKLDIKVLNGQTRESGKVVDRTKRVSGVVYGKSQDSTAISVDKVDLQRVYDNLGHSSLFDLKIEGSSESISVLLHEVQRQPNTNDIIHFDLYAITKGQKVQTDISIHFEGEPGAQGDTTKVISTITDVIQIEALPKDLPDQISLDISGLAEVGDHRLVSDISMPSGVEVLTEPETIVIKIDEAREEPEPEEVEETEEGESDGEEKTDEDGNDSESSEEKSE